MIKCILVICVLVFVIPTWLPIFIGMVDLAAGAIAYKVTLAAGIIIAFLYVKRQPWVTEILYNRKLNRMKRKGLLPPDATKIVQDKDNDK